MLAGVRMSMNKRRKAHLLDRQRAVMEGAATIALMHGPDLNGGEGAQAELRARKAGAEFMRWTMFNRNNEELVGFPFIGAARYALAYPCAPRHTYGDKAGRADGEKEGAAAVPPHAAAAERHANAASPSVAAADELTAAAKVVKTILDPNLNPAAPEGMLLLGIFHTREQLWYTPADLARVAKLGEPAELYGKLLGAMNAPSTQLVGTIDGARGGKLLANMAAPGQALAAILANRPEGDGAATKDE